VSHHGLLLTMTEPRAAMEEEFNAGYDSEHLPERLGIPGFRSARRWIADCAPGDGKYLATYELDSPAVLQSPAYVARYTGATPWSRRCLGRCVLFKRWACEQLAHGLLLVASDAQTAPPGIAGTLQTRRFIASAGEPAYIALVELSTTSARLPLPAAGVLMRLYRAYAA
jgi:hypothetical protein